MIAVDERPTSFASADAEASRPGKPPVARMSAVVLALAVLSTLGGGGLVDSGGSYALQARAIALHAHWDYMRANGIPDADLAGLEQEWRVSQANRIISAPLRFWLPGGAETLDRWQTEGDAIWQRDLTRYRSDALTSERSLHNLLAPESFVDRKSRLDALATATTPLDFATLRDEWTLEARLVPIDRRIAAIVAAVITQVQGAKQLGIRSDPALMVLARASQYAGLDATSRMARAELLSRSLLAVRVDLQGRLDTAAVTQQNLQHANEEVSLAALYGISVSAYQTRLTADQNAYAAALTVAQFKAVTADTLQVAASADNDIAVVTSQTHVLSGVPMIYQDHPL
ncbi:MAG TPA: hypothetical protein VHO95_04185, partial [Candidatus Dormibacteraeota bacterium]|nr:hypothetical protein [Candidatus Dormibacteraeota bacterium]